MKENIEEDIKIVEKLIKTMEQDRITFKDEQSKEIYAYFITALEHILSDYKRVLKENEELKEKIDLYEENIILLQKKLTNSIYATQIKKDYLSKQKIKDKIEELKSYKGLVIYERCNYESQIKTLQDLLEEKGE